MSGKRRRPIGRKSIYYKIFFTNHELPLPCAYCSKIIDVMDSSKVIHHVDEDPWNNSIENLQLMHQTCHKAHHATGKTPMLGRTATEATKIKMREAQLLANAEGRGAKDFPGRNEKISASRARRVVQQVHSPETRAKIGAGSRETRKAERKQCPHCDLVSNNGAVARHVKAKHS